MSERGRKIFDNYIASSLANIDLEFEHPERYLTNLLNDAKLAGVHRSEIEEEVGDLTSAIKAARVKKDSDA